MSDEEFDKIISAEILVLIILFFYTDCGRWYPQACNFLHLKHILHSSLEKSIIERAMQYFKDRTECFDDYYPCMQKEECNLFHVHNWIQFFVSMYNDTIANNKNYFC